MQKAMFRQIGVIALRTPSGKFLTPNPLYILVDDMDKYGLTDLESESVRDSVGFFVAKINAKKEQEKNEGVI